MFMLSLIAAVLTLFGMCFSIKFGGHKYLTNIFHIMIVIFTGIAIISYFKAYSKNEQNLIKNIRKQRKQ